LARGGAWREAPLMVGHHREEESREDRKERAPSVKTEFLYFYAAPAAVDQGLDRRLQWNGSWAPSSF
jgi:hypothetical protein